MMKNIDKIRAMSAEELANLIVTKNTDICASCMAFKYCKSEKNTSNCCEQIIENWLNQEINPMPQIQIGDVIFTYLNKSYVGLVVMSDIHASNLHGFMVKWRELDDICKIERINDEKESVEVIWRADNGQ